MHLHFLLADHDPDDIQLFGLAVDMSQLPIQLKVVSSCEQIISCLREEYMPDVIVTDGKFVDGLIDCICSLRGHMALKLRPLFVLSGHDSRRMRDICLEAGATDYFEKPSTFEDLVETIKVMYHSVRSSGRVIAG